MGGSLMNFWAAANVTSCGDSDQLSDFQSSGISDPRPLHSAEHGAKARTETVEVCGSGSGPSTPQLGGTSASLLCPWSLDRGSVRP